MSTLLSEAERELWAVRVARGAKFLDDRIDDWHNRIEIEMLDMTDGRWCVIGQLFPEHMFFRKQKDFGWSNAEAASLGFYLNEAEFDSEGYMAHDRWLAMYEEIRECWIGQIADRINGAVPVHG